MTDKMVQQIVTDEAAKSMATFVYALQAASLITGIPLFIAVIVNYVKRKDVEGTLAESHFRWQIRTFWYTLFWTVLGCLTLLIMIGAVILFLVWIWTIYRVVRGWLDLISGQAMYR